MPGQTIFCLSISLLTDIRVVPTFLLEPSGVEQEGLCPLPQDIGQCLEAALIAANEGGVSVQAPWPGVLLSILQCKGGPPTKHIQPQMSLVLRAGGPASMGVQRLPQTFRAPQ